MPTKHQYIRVALLDLYDDYPNTEIKNFLDLIAGFNSAHHLNLTCDVFDVRGKIEVPGTEYDIYISSGGPGSPVDSEGSAWEERYFALIDQLNAHNQKAHSQKKHVLFVCHSFQLMCRRLGLGTVNQRDDESFGIYPVYQTKAGYTEVLFAGLQQPFYTMDMREWQVVNADEAKMAALGAALVAIEMERKDAGLPRAMMAVRFNPYFFGTQFHPEVEPGLLKTQMMDEKHKEKFITEYGEGLYHNILQKLGDETKLQKTYHTLVPAFLSEAVKALTSPPSYQKY